MRRFVTDEDIQSFLARNASKHESQIALIQSALHFLWPDGAPHEAIDRVVVAALARPATVGPSRRASPPAAGASLSGL